MSQSQNSVSFGISFRKSGLKTAFSIKIRVAFPKTEVLGKPPIIGNISIKQWKRFYLWAQENRFMLLKSQAGYVIFHQGESRFSFLRSGDIFEFVHANIMLNQFQGSAREGSVNNIWLRVYEGGKPAVQPLLGLYSGSHILRAPDQLVYTGAFNGVGYTVTFRLPKPGLWFWKIDLEGPGKTVDLLYGQDTGIAAKAAVLTNELYIAQYLDHRPLTGERGWVVCSRQNQDQNGLFPYLQQGMIRGRTAAFSTDGIQFFGLSYRGTHVPRALFEDLPSRKVQGEFSYTALQSEKVTLKGGKTLAFYGIFRSDHREAVQEIEFAAEIEESYRSAFEDTSAGKDLTAGADLKELKPLRIRKVFASPPYTSPPWDKAVTDCFFPSRFLEEWDNEGELLSFFTADHAHVVLQAKELRTERPHGTIITTKINEKEVDVRLITSTAYLYGIFNGQTTAGNTSFHKFLSAARGQFNLLKNSGQRIYVKINGVFSLLTLPAAFEMGMNYARWFYPVEDDTLVISSFAAADSMDIVLNLHSVRGRARDFIITHQLVLGDNEFRTPVDVETIENGLSPILRFRPDQSVRKESPYPGLHYDLHIPGVSFTWSDDRIFFEDGEPKNGTLLTVAINGIDHFQIIIQGRLEEEPAWLAALYDFDGEKKKYAEFWERFSGGFHLELDNNEPGILAGSEVKQLNETAFWFSHNALVHFAVPHGLEQPGGAAWGTRDVCQGPLEYFLAFGHFSLARSTLLIIFSHQFLETGEWPQWFMFDRYTVNAGECHGDIVFWPLKALADYIAASGDEGLLREMVPWRRHDTRSGEEAPVLLHIKKAVAHIESRLVRGTALVSYASGDWDDTLQPVEEKMKEGLVSTWTQALGIQTLRTLAEAVKTLEEEYAAHLESLAEQMARDFEKFFIKDKIIAGFLRFDNDKPVWLLHPADQVTGIHYRLIPLTRSIIAEIVDREQGLWNVRVIDEQLRDLDGVRLMDRPARYDGGPSRLFRRAEQAANVGREIGLHYVHAHIRWLEALAKLGLHESLWDGLFRINPIALTSRVPLALPRQRNMYFSSSDGDFADRYQFSEQFSLLREGRIPVKGGWRLYSSGPGIYLRQIVSNILGIRLVRGGIVIDPVLPPALDGLRFTFTCYSQKILFAYAIRRGERRELEVSRNGKPLAGDPESTRYRGGTFFISREELLREPGEIAVNLKAPSV
jgi:cellobiose phosphorylase